MIDELGPGVSRGQSSDASTAAELAPPQHTRTPFHVLIVNQHGDNRGDESALRAMLDEVERQLGSARFTIVHQFADPDAVPTVPQTVEWMTLKVSPLEGVRLAAYAALRALNVRVRPLLGAAGRRIVAAYESADVVVSAPGGPYFGDAYAGHEPVHWFYVWLARAHRRPAVLYAPSAGPFARRWMNPFRRFTYRCFDAVALRERQSAEHVAELMGPGFAYEVTADAAFQESPSPLERERWSVDGRPLGDRFLVVVSALKSLPSARRRDARPPHYDDAIVGALTKLAATRDVHIAFAPQLYGRRHDDSTYLRSLARKLPPGVSCEVLPTSLSSTDQRRRFAAADLVIAGRYHPAVFAISACVPVVCIPYEHKAIGVMDAAGLGRFVVDMHSLSIDALSDAIERAIAEKDQTAAALAEVAPKMQNAARRTSAIVAAAARSGRR